MEKMRLQTHYCTDPNKSKLANLQLGVLPRGTFYNHTETDRVEHRRKSTSWVGRFTTADRWVSHVSNLTSSVLIQNAKTHLAK